MKRAFVLSRLWSVPGTLHLVITSVRNTAMAIDGIPPIFQGLLSWEEFVSSLFEFGLKLAVQFFLQFGMCSYINKVFHLVWISLVVVHQPRAV